MKVQSFNFTNTVQNLLSGKYTTIVILSYISPVKELTGRTGGELSMEPELPAHIFPFTAEQL